ncbi:hypothetical protein ACHAWC_009142 [Mediolabrus comicus]
MSSSSSQTRGGVCHILPCSIDEDITAPVAQYFHPTTLPSQGNNNDKNDVTIMAAQFRGRGLLCATDGPQEEEVDGSNDAGDCVDLTNNEVQSNNDDTTANETSSLSHKRPLSKLPSTMVGVVFNNRQHSMNNTTGSINKSHDSNNSNKDPPMQPLTTIEKFHKIYNWRHEHDETKIMRENRFGGSEKEGLNAVLGWCELSHAIHDPIPLPQKQT